MIGSRRLKRGCFWNHSIISPTRIPVAPVIIKDRSSGRKSMVSPMQERTYPKITMTELKRAVLGKDAIDLFGRLRQGDFFMLHLINQLCQFRDLIQLQGGQTLNGEIHPSPTSDWPSSIMITFGNATISQVRP